MAEEATSDTLNFECSFNERSKNDQVYLYFEDFNSDNIVEAYVSVQEFKSLLKAMMRLDEQIGKERIA
jgi:hypothetical protein